MASDTELLARLRAAIAARNVSDIEAAIEQIDEHGDLVDALEDVSRDELRSLADLIGDESAGEMLADFDPGEAADLLERLDSGEAADILETMDPDEAADIVGELEPIEADQIMVAMEAIEAEEIRELLAYPPDTAGGRMTPEFVSISPTLRADQTVVALRRLAQEAETINYVYVTDEADHMLGVLSLRYLVLSPPETLVSELMVRDIRFVKVTDDQEEAARVLVEHDLLAVPVVDDDLRLIGIITAEDVTDILEQEVTEDIERLGGSQPLDESYLRAKPTLLWRRRIVWLLALFVAQAYTGTVLQIYQDELTAVVALSFFIPLLIGTGGNVGSQVVMTIVRAMAVGDVRFRDMFRIVRKEGQTGLMLGVVMAIVAFLRAVWLGVGYDLATVVAVSVTAIVLWAALVAAVLPLLLKQLRVDPAVVSAPFIATLVDGTGLMIYFTVARLILDFN